MRYLAVFIALLLALWHGLSGVAEVWDGLYTLLVVAGVAYPMPEYWNDELIYITYTYGALQGPAHLLAGLARLLPALGLAAGAALYAASDRRGVLIAAAGLLLVGTAGALLLHNAESLYFRGAYDMAFMLYWGDLQGFGLAYTIGSFRFFVVALLDLLLFAVTLGMTGLMVFAARPTTTDE